jgi:multidrug efflux pump
MQAMFAHFFVDRPIFASVLSIVVVLAGILTVRSLPVAQYPEITPPTIEVTAAYPGANARVVADTVASPIEREINGVERMLYMESKSTNDGNLKLTITFELGTDLDTAQVLVQNRVSLAVPKLPDVVKQTGVSTKKKSPSIILTVNLSSPNGRYDQLYLSNYAALQVKDALAQLPGVGDVSFLGEREYSMRIWLDPNRVAERGLTAGDVVQAIREQNVQVAAGKIGQPPAANGLDFEYSISAQGRLLEESQFADIILKTGDQGEITRLSDVGHVELSAKNADVSSTLDGKPTITLAVFQLPGSNALETAHGIRQKMDDLALRFPKGLRYDIVYDTTPFIDESIHEVFKAFRDAVILVAIVVLVFLQNWRATIIPLLAVPVAIVGTFAFMTLLGFSLNNLTLFGLVLAIGIVVDDAIVVVEAVEHHMEHGLSPRGSTRKAIDEVAGPIIATTLVLCAVFVPTAFITGITGQFFKQFALTIAVSTVISSFNSLTLSPALCALLLKPKGESRDPLSGLLNFSLGWFFRGFNHVFNAFGSFYTGGVSRLLRGAAIALLVYAGLLVLTYVGMTKMPTGFIPNQDKGYLLVDVQLPEAASLERTKEVMRSVEEVVRKTDGVKHTLGVQGMSLLSNVNGSNWAGMFVILDSFDNRRHDSKQSADSIAAELRGELRTAIRDARVNVFGAPPVDGLGNASGFKMQVQDRADVGPAILQAVADRLAREANARPGLVSVFNSFSAKVPQLFVDVDRAKAKVLGVPLNHVFEALQVYLGSLYVNDITLFARNYQVVVQADSMFRRRPNDIGRLKVRNARGETVPLATVVQVRDTNGPAIVTRYNMLPSAAVSGGTLPGVSSGQAIREMEQTTKEVFPPTIGFQWTELTLLQILAGNTAIIVFALAVVLVFLVLAAQYESWTLPLAVILVVPMCLLCAIIGVAVARDDINIFTQIGFVVLVGLASKNAILIVEFAKAQRDSGVPPFEATVAACKLRFRPIIMTSLAFILGVVPLVLAHGAGAEMRRTLGIAVFSGMLGVTIFGVFLTPVFFYAIQRMFNAKDKSAIAAEHAEGSPPP